MLTEIHRQVAGDPIIQLSKYIREGGRLTYGALGECSVIPRKISRPRPAKLCSSTLMIRSISAAAVAEASAAAAS